MQLQIRYWFLVGLLGFLHIYFIFGHAIPFYLIVLLICAILYYLHNNVLINTEALGVKWNSLLYGIQIMLLLFSLVSSEKWISISLLIGFIGVEVIRCVWGRMVSELKMSIENHDEQLQQINETFRVVRNERHDFLKHIASIQFMLENNNATGAKEYINELVDGYEQTNLSIKGESGVVAGVLHQAFQRSKKTGIELIYDLDIPLSTLPLSDQKKVTLIGNLLTNSIDACEDWKKNKREQATVVFQFYKRSGLYILQCKNNSLRIPDDVLDGLFQSHGKTTKGGTHEGLGTKMIREIVEEHNGFLDFVHKNEEFTVKIKIPAIK